MSKARIGIPWDCECDRADTKHRREKGVGEKAQDPGQSDKETLLPERACWDFLDRVNVREVLTPRKAAISSKAPGQSAGCSGDT